MNAKSAVDVRKAHRTTSAVLGAFGVLHLANHWFAPLGAEWHLKVQGMMRGVYANPVTEPVLLCSMLAQVVTGVMLWYQTRPIEGMVQPQLRKWRRWSGAYLTFSLVAHPGAALVQRYLFGLDSNFYWAAAVLRWPLALWFVPYYTLGILSFVVHVGAAVAPRHMRVWALVGALTCLVVIGGLGGWFATFEIPPEYR